MALLTNFPLDSCKTPVVSQSLCVKLTQLILVSHSFVTEPVWNLFLLHNSTYLTWFNSRQQLRILQHFTNFPISVGWGGESEKASWVEMWKVWYNSGKVIMIITKNCELQEEQVIDNKIAIKIIIYEKS